MLLTTLVLLAHGTSNAPSGVRVKLVYLNKKDVEASIPFNLLGFDCDNGSGFINWHLLGYFRQCPKPVQFARLRPYHKDGNAHPEQKNWTQARQWLGYGCFDNPAAAPLLNGLFGNEWRLYHNFFMPSVKLIEKNKLQQKPSSVMISQDALPESHEAKTCIQDG